MVAVALCDEDGRACLGVAGHAIAVKVGHPTAIGSESGDRLVIDEANRGVEGGRQAATAGNPGPLQMPLCSWVGRWRLDLENHACGRLDHAFGVQPTSPENEATGDFVSRDHEPIEGGVLRTHPLKGGVSEGHWLVRSDTGSQ